MRPFFLTLALALALPGAAQECSSYVVVNLYYSKLGIDIQTLKSTDLDARVNKASVKVESAGQDYKTRLLVLLETDGASNNPQIGDAVDTITRLARQAPEGQPVAFGVYADRTVLTKGFFADPQERTAAINAVREEAGSLEKRVAMYDALLTGLKLFGAHQPGDAVLLVGYPFDDKSGHGPGKVEHEFLSTNTRLLVMLREPLSNTTRDFMFNSHSAEKSMFANLTAQTGGAYTDFDPHFFSWVWRGYMLEVKLPGGPRSSRPQRWKLKLQGPAAEALRRAKLYYPDSLPPCSAPEK